MPKDTQTWNCQARVSRWMVGMRVEAMWNPWWVERGAILAWALHKSLSNINLNHFLYIWYRIEIPIAITTQATCTNSCALTRSFVPSPYRI